MSMQGEGVRVERIGDATLYLGNALEILPGLDAADLVVTDPPYRLTTGGVSKSSKTMSGIFAAHNYANDGQLVMSDVQWATLMPAIFASLKLSADAYVMANDKNLFPAMAAAFDSGFGLHNILTWDKVTPTANRWYMKNIEFTLYLWKGRARTINFPSSKQGIRGNQIDESGHPTEKPVWLMAEYIRNSSKPGDVVLDPFMGSGTTGVAALQQGRRFVGIELDPAHFDSACRRLDSALNQGQLFAEVGT
jgi:site-specific DNA-methyltransferase (adenine-specific)